ncbi:MAG: radical SAM protein, partial [Lachnospiraceae bacterium]|nr:radical SAM protein [Lachnospiraceae bacterium]
MKKTSFTIVVTTECNLNCTYCYEKHFNRAVMTREVAEKTVEFIKNKIKENKLEYVIIRFHGGEPLLNTEVIKFIMDELETQPCKIGYFMTTNATLIKEEMLPFLRKIDALSVSMDGTEEEHDRNRIDKGGKGTYQRVLEKVKLLLEYMPNLTARMTVTPDTYKNIYTNFISLSELGIRNIDPFLDFTSDVWTSEMLAEYMDEMKKVAIYIKEKEKENITIRTAMIGTATTKTKNTLCGGGKTSFSITPEGNIYPCMEVAFNKAFLLGNVEAGCDNCELLEEIEKVGHERNKSCDGCGRYDYCMVTRCKIVNYAHTGDYNLPKPIMCANEHIKLGLEKYLIN